MRRVSQVFPFASSARELMYAAKLASMFAYKEQAITNTRLSRQTVKPGTESATQTSTMLRWNRLSAVFTLYQSGTLSAPAASSAAVRPSPWSGARPGAGACRDA